MHILCVLLKQLVIMPVSVSFVSPQCTKEFKVCAAAQGRSEQQSQSSKASRLALTSASVVLLSFPMAQPAAGPQLPKPTASHISWLKDTSTEGRSEFDYSQRDTE